MAIQLGFTSEEFDQIEVRQKIPRCGENELGKLAKMAMKLGLIRCCAPYWVKDERMFLIEVVSTGNVYRASQQEAIFFLTGLLELQKQNG